MKRNEAINKSALYDGNESYLFINQLLAWWESWCWSPACQNLGFDIFQCAWCLFHCTLKFKIGTYESSMKFSVCVCVSVCVCARLFLTVWLHGQDPPGFSVHGIFQGSMLEWVAISFSRGSSWPRDRIHQLHCRKIVNHCATWEAQLKSCNTVVILALERKTLLCVKCESQHGNIIYRWFVRSGYWLQRSLKIFLG